jgi:hypothetical protein
LRGVCGSDGSDKDVTYQRKRLHTEAKGILADERKTFFRVF